MASLVCLLCTNVCLTSFKLWQAGVSLQSAISSDNKEAILQGFHLTQF